MCFISARPTTHHHHHRQHFQWSLASLSHRSHWGQLCHFQDASASCRASNHNWAHFIKSRGCLYRGVEKHLPDGAEMNLIHYASWTCSPDRGGSNKTSQDLSIIGTEHWRLQCVQENLRLNMVKHSGISRPVGWKDATLRRNNWPTGTRMRRVSKMSKPKPTRKKTDIVHLSEVSRYVCPAQRRAYTSDHRMTLRVQRSSIQQPGGSYIAWRGGRCFFMSQIVQWMSPAHKHTCTHHLPPEGNWGSFEHSPPLRLRQLVVTDNGPRCFGLVPWSRQNGATRSKHLHLQLK